MERKSAFINSIVKSKKLFPEQDLLWIRSPQTMFDPAGKTDTNVTKIKDGNSSVTM